MENDLNWCPLPIRTKTYFCWNHSTIGMLILAQNLFITYFANPNLDCNKPFWPSSVCRPYWYRWNTTLTYSNLNYSNLTLDHPLTFNRKPQPKCIDSFLHIESCIKTWTINLLTFVTIHVCSYVCIIWLLYCLFIVICFYCIDWTESYELRWKECVSNDNFIKASDTPA